MRFSIFIAVLFCFISGASAGVLFEVKGWKGQAFFEKNGRLSFCEAATTYRSGDKRILLMFRNKRLSLVYETNVRFKDKWKYPSTLYIDRKPLAQGDGIGAARGSLILPLPPTKRMFSSLYNGQSIQIMTRATPMKSYSLAGSAAALLKLKQCVNVFSRPAQLAQKKLPPVRKSTGRKRRLAKFNKSELMVMASRLLNNLGIHGWEFVDFGPPGITGDIAWKYNKGGYGSIVAYKPEARVSLEIATEVMASKDGKTCKGKLLTMQEPVEKTKNGGRMKKLDTICRQGKFVLRNSYVILQATNRALFIINTEVAHRIKEPAPQPETSDYQPSANEL